jgi:hypothetical protein
MSHPIIRLLSLSTELSIRLTVITTLVVGLFHTVLASTSLQHVTLVFYRYIELCLQWDPHPFLFGSPATYDTCVCTYSLIDLLWIPCQILFISTLDSLVRSCPYTGLVGGGSHNFSRALERIESEDSSTWSSLSTSSGILQPAKVCTHLYPFR